MAGPGRRPRGLCAACARPRAVLLAVPALWLCVILWTVYDANMVQQNEYRQALRDLQRRQQQERERHTQEKEQQARDIKQDLDNHKHRIGKQNEKLLESNRDVLRTNGSLDTKSLQKKNFILRKWQKEVKDNVLARPSFEEKNIKNDPAEGDPSHTEAPPPDDFEEYVWEGPGPSPGKRRIVPGGRFDPPKGGEHGRPLVYDPRHMGPEDRAKYDQGWSNHQYNEWASMQISTQREIPDFRNQGCRAADYGSASLLPRASVIICFYNEAWSVLLRTIHSVLSRAPPSLVEEIILVDDHSDMPTLLGPLRQYVSQVAKLRLLRMRERAGLVRARLAGVRRARADVLLFLDSHVECAEGWLTPLLKVIKDKPKVAVTPEIDVIDHKTFAVQAAVDNIGILDFRSFSFDWSPLLPRLQAKRSSEADVIESPTMAGGLFAIRKDYFLELGTYDTDLELWGGENIELSLKLWMCGGGILIHPCSRVAHIFRDQSPYLKGSKENVLSKNSARVAQVWADDWRGMYFKGGKYDEARYGSVAERLQLKHDLGCRSFSWYVDTIYPEINTEFTGRCQGQIQLSKGCMHTSGFDGHGHVSLVPCQKVETWFFGRTRTVGTHDLCLEVTSRGLEMNKCVHKPSAAMTWEYTARKIIRHPSTNNCLTATMNSVTMATCTGSDDQTWEWPINPNYII